MIISYIQFSLKFFNSPFIQLLSVIFKGNLSPLTQQQKSHINKLIELNLSCFTMKAPDLENRRLMSFCPNGNYKPFTQILEPYDRYLEMQQNQQTLKQTTVGFHCPDGNRSSFCFFLVCYSSAQNRLR